MDSSLKVLVSFILFFVRKDYLSEKMYGLMFITDIASKILKM